MEDESIKQETGWWDSLNFQNLILSPLSFYLMNCGKIMTITLLCSWMRHTSTKISLLLSTKSCTFPYRPLLLCPLLGIPSQCGRTKWKHPFTSEAIQWLVLPLSATNYQGHKWLLKSFWGRPVEILQFCTLRGTSDQRLEDLPAMKRENFIRWRDKGQEGKVVQGLINTNSVCFSPAVYGRWAYQ